MADQRFRRGSIYDAPEQVLGLLLDGELSTRGLVGAVLDPARLSPKERDNALARIRAAAGDNPVAKGLADLALSPWTWFMVLTTVPGFELFRPAGQVALRAGRRVSDIPARLSAFVREHQAPLQALGLLSQRESLLSTPAPAIFQEAIRHVDDMAREEAAMIGDAYEKVVRRIGARNLDWMDPRNAGKEDLVREVAYALVGTLEGWDRSVKTVLLRPKKGRAAVDWVRTVIRGPLVGTPMEAHLRRLAGEEGVELAKRTRDALTVRAWRLFGKDERVGGGLLAPGDLLGRKFEVDPVKVINQYRSLRNEVFSGRNSVPKRDVSRAMVSRLLGPEGADLVRTGRITQDDFLKLIEGNFAKQVDPESFWPRNIIDTLTPDGRLMSEQEWWARRSQQKLRPSGTALPRTRVLQEYLPEDLEYIRDTFGGGVPTRQMADSLRGATKRAEAARAAGRDLRVRRVNFHQGIAKYMGDTQQTWAWHVAPAGQEVRAAQRETYRHATAPPGREGYFEPGLGGARASVTKTFDDIEREGLVPQGGRLNLADAAKASYVLMKNPYDKALISDLLVPMVAGQMGVKHAGSAAAIIQSREMLRGIADGFVGKALESLGEPGRRIVAVMRRRADPRFALEEGRRWARGAANYLYTTHQGGNLPSVVLNSFQPILTVAPLLGLRNTLGAYWDSIRELGSYVVKRVERHGIGPITNAQRDMLLQETHQFARTKELGDVLNVRANPFEVVDHIGFNVGKAHAKPSKFEVMFEYLMAGFAKMELLNRNTTAHAVRRAYQRSGRSTSEPGFLQDVANTVGLTQFAAGPLDTPAALLTADERLGAFGRLLTHPLIRQYLTFQTRAFTNAFFTGPQLGAVEGSSALRTLIYLARATAISGFTLEAAKATLGADLERAGFVAAATDIVPGLRSGRFDAEESVVPLPPVVAIPTDFIRGWMTDDYEMMKSAVWRLAPGGVAINRLLASFGPVPVLHDLGLQQRTAGWGQITPDGRVPIFDGQGRLISLEDPKEVIYRALGADLGRFQEGGDLDHYIVRQSEEIARYKQEALRALMANDQASVQSVQREFMTRFGLPLTLSRSQVQNAFAVRSQTRTERVYDKLPSDAKSAYRKIITQTRGESLAVPPEALEQKPSERERPAFPGPARTPAFEAFESY